MKKITIAALLSCFFAQAQIVYEKGYFINNAGKKTDCFIENVDWRNNPTTFNYKVSENDSDKKVENIMGVSEFGIDNVSMYRRFTVNIERSQNLSTNLSNSKAPKWNSETLFLLALVAGDASLYSYVDGNVMKYFYETKNTPIEQLVYIRYITSNSADDGLNSFSETIQDNNQYKQQLNNNVKCGEMNERTFLNLEYKKNSLVKHFLSYNNCKGSGAEKVINYTANDSDRETFSLRVVVGVSSNKLSITDPSKYYDMTTDISQIGYRFGVDAEYILPFKKGQWSIFANPSYQKFNPTKDYTTPINSPGFSSDGTPVNYHLEVNYSYVEIPVGVRRYFFVTKNVRIFANIAYTLVFAKSGGSMDFTNSNNLVNAKENISIIDQNNIALGVGCTYGRFSAEIRYNFERQISEYLLWDAGYKSLGLNLGFKIL